METVARIRRDHLGRGVPIKQIARDLKLSRNTVGKVVREDKTSLCYDRKTQPLPKLGPWVEALEQLLEANEGKGRRDRLSLVRMYEELAVMGYDGGSAAISRSRVLRSKSITRPKSLRKILSDGTPKMPSSSRSTDGSMQALMLA